jgi:hypothetical protein
MWSDGKVVTGKQKPDYTIPDEVIPRIRPEETVERSSLPSERGPPRHPHATPTQHHDDSPCPAAQPPTVN